MPTVIKLRSSTPLADCRPCQVAREQELAAAEQQIPTPPATAAKITWSGPIVHEGQMTGDGRFIEPNALTWGELPIPLRWVKEDSGEHNGAVVVGRIIAIERQSGGVIMARGDFDTGSAEGVEAARQVRETLTRGVSVDLDNVSFEVRVARELVEGDEVPGTPDDAKVDENGRITVLDIDADAEVMDIDDARIRAATLLAVPAFEGARIKLDEDSDTDDTDGTDESDESDDEDDLVAAGGPNRPPAAWFTDPHLAQLTPLTVTDDGRIFGHAAGWDSCHTGFQQECVAPPHSASGYGYFRTGSLITADGTEVPVGHITLDTFHAGKRLGPVDTIAHYEHTGATVADVAAGEDTFGIWIAGAARPNLSDDQLRTLRSSPLSGDWRRIGGNLELVAALAVNVPGFPVPRVQGLVASSGAVQTLVASGIVRGLYDKGGRLPTGVTTVARSEDAISDEALSWLQRQVEPQHRKAKAATLHRRMQVDRLRRRVEKVG